MRFLFLTHWLTHWPTHWPFRTALPSFGLVLAVMGGGTSFLMLGCSGGNGTTIEGPSSSASSTQPEGDVTGSWTGTWLSRTGVGGLTTSTFTQSGNAVDGEFHFTGSPCFSAAKFKGTMSGGDLTGTATAGGIRVQLSITVTSTSLDGSYTVLEGGACSSDTGTFSAKR